MNEDTCSAARRSFLKALPVVTAGAAVPSLGAQAPGARHHWAMLVDIRRCIGCQACTVSCFMENAVPEDNFRTIVSTYAVEQLREGKKEIGTFMLPRLCNHCSNPPCVPVCPVGATFKQPDGEVVVNAERCVGCAYCVQACPYDARFINHETGKADKCTFCTLRLQAGLLPACVETCVGGARLFGDLNDPHSEINRLMALHKDELKTLKPEAGTHPNVFYIGLEDEFVGRIDGEANLWRPTAHGA